MTQRDKGPVRKKDLREGLFMWYSDSYGRVDGHPVLVTKVSTVKTGYSFHILNLKTFEEELEACEEASVLSLFHHCSLAKVKGYLHERRDNLSAKIIERRAEITNARKRLEDSKKQSKDFNRNSRLFLKNLSRREA